MQLLCCHTVHNVNYTAYINPLANKVTVTGMVLCDYVGWDMATVVQCH